MKESIYTIPISEAFEPMRGCPFCAIRRSQEQRCVEYITGPAMMEPDVRLKTNKQGFCGRHYRLTLEQRNRLSVALMLQSRLESLITELSAPKPLPLSGGQDCFICGEINREFERVLENVAVVWKRDNDFQNLYTRQEYVCLPDCGRMLSVARKKLGGARFKEFSRVTSGLVLKGLMPLKSDIDAFCGLYDYRSPQDGAPPVEVATAIERAIAFLYPE